MKFFVPFLSIKKIKCTQKTIFFIPLFHCDSQSWINFPTAILAFWSWGGSSGLDGYIFAQCAVPGIKIALLGPLSWVMPKACQGSNEPCTKTTLVTCMPLPPYMVLVLSMPLLSRLKSYLRRSKIFRWAPSIAELVSVGQSAGCTIIRTRARSQSN